MNQWTPLFGTIITIAFGALTYLFQKQRDRKEELIKIRRSEYRKWVQSLYDVMATNKVDALLDFNKATNDLFLFGSDKVVEAVGKFKEYMAVTSRDDGSGI